MLYATVAQIAATFVSILGGFLLTIGLSRAAEKRRHQRSLERNRQVHEDIADENEAYGKRKERAETDHRETLLSIRLRALRGQLDQEQEVSEQIAANNRLISLNEERIVQLEDHVQRTQTAKRDAEDIIDRIEVQMFQIKIVGVGFLLLLLLGIVGVGVPLYILPIESDEEGRLVGWIAQRGTIVLLGCLIIYVWAVSVLAGNEPYFDSTLDRLTNLLWLCTVAFWLLWPYSAAHWAVIVVGWSLNVLTIGTWAFRVWSRRGKSPTESSSDGLNIRHRKRTNLLRWSGCRRQQPNWEPLGLCHSSTIASSRTVTRRRVDRSLATSSPRRCPAPSRSRFAKRSR